MRSLMLAVVGCVSLSSSATTIRRVQPSIVEIRAYRKNGDYAMGTGFAVRRNVICTAYHVVDGSANGEKFYVIPYGSEDEIAATILAADPEHDIALLLVPELDLQPLGLARRTPRPGDRILIGGHPLGLLNSWTSGMIAAVRSEGLLLDAMVGPGNSGGPVLSTDGRVLGVTSQMTKGGTGGFGLAVPTKYVIKLVSRSVH